MIRYQTPLIDIWWRTVEGDIQFGEVAVSYTMEDYQKFELFFEAAEISRLNWTKLFQLLLDDFS